MSVDRSNGDFTVHCWRTRGREKDSVGSRWYNHTHFRKYFTNCRTYQLYWRKCWNCPLTLSLHFWHLFIIFPITRYSSPLLMLISSRILGLRFSSSRVRGFVLYTAFFNLRGLCCFLDTTLPVAWNLLYRLWTVERDRIFTPGNHVSMSLRTWLADWVIKYWS